MLSPIRPIIGFSGLARESKITGSQLIGWITRNNLPTKPAENGLKLALPGKPSVVILNGRGCIPLNHIKSVAQILGIPINQLETFVLKKASFTL